MWQWSAEGRNTSLDLSQPAGQEKDCWGKVSFLLTDSALWVVTWVCVSPKAPGRRWWGGGHGEMRVFPRLPVEAPDKHMQREWDCRYGGRGSPGHSGSFMDWAFALKELKNAGETLRGLALWSSEWSHQTYVVPFLFFFQLQHYSFAKMTVPGEW